MSKTTRKSPSISATEYEIGTTKKGNDGNQWLVAMTSNGIKRWMPVTNSIKYENDHITMFDVNKVIPKLKMGSIKKIGQLEITSNKIGVGEMFFDILPSSKGKYNIYYFQGSLIAVHQDSSLRGQIFKMTKYDASCDMGMFSFIDYARVKKYLPKNNNQTVKKIFGEQFPDFNIDIFQIPKMKNSHKEYEFVLESDLIINENSIPNKSETPIAIFANNLSGDGSFHIYKGNNAYWIMSQDVHDEMIELIKPY